METVSFPQLCLEMAQGKVSVRSPPPSRDLKQEEEFAAWKSVVTSRDKGHIWSSELSWGVVGWCPWCFKLPELKGVTQRVGSGFCLGPQ